MCEAPVGGFGSLEAPHVPRFLLFACSGEFVCVNLVFTLFSLFSSSFPFPFLFRLCMGKENELECASARSSTVGVPQVCSVCTRCIIAVVLFHLCSLMKPWWRNVWPSFAYSLLSSSKSKFVLFHCLLLS